jgi:hypothetical protein
MSDVCLATAVSPLVLCGDEGGKVGVVHERWCSALADEGLD